MTGDNRGDEGGYGFTRPSAEEPDVPTPEEFGQMLEASMVEKQELRELAAKWREIGTGNADWCEYNEGMHDALRACAKELEEVLEE